MPLSYLARSAPAAHWPLEGQSAVSLSPIKIRINYPPSVTGSPNAPSMRRFILNPSESEPIGQDRWDWAPPTGRSSLPVAKQGGGTQSFCQMAVLAYLSNTGMSVDRPAPVQPKLNFATRPWVRFLTWSAVCRALASSDLETSCLAPSPALMGPDPIQDHSAWAW